MVEQKPLDERAAHGHADDVGALDAHRIEDGDGVARKIGNRIGAVVERPCRATGVAMVVSDHVVCSARLARNRSGHISPDALAPITSSSGEESRSPLSWTHNRTSGATST